MLAISNLLFRNGDRRFRNRAETAQKKRFLMLVTAKIVCHPSLKTMSEAERMMLVTAKIVCHPSVTMIRH